MWRPIDTGISKTDTLILYTYTDKKKQKEIRKKRIRKRNFFRDLKLAAQKKSMKKEEEIRRFILSLSLSYRKKQRDIKIKRMSINPYLSSKSKCLSESTYIYAGVYNTTKSTPNDTDRQTFTSKSSWKPHTEYETNLSLMLTQIHIQQTNKNKYKIKLKEHTKLLGTCI